MFSQSQIDTQPSENLFTAVDVALLLRRRHWLKEELATASAWTFQAAALLGPRASCYEALEALLTLVFEYDAKAILADRTNQQVLARAGARDVLRALATEILSGGPVNSERLKEIVNAVKARLPYRSRDLFLPLRVAIAGRAGGGELDRVILLIDSAAQAPGLAPVKSVRARILEFCSALD